MPKTPTRIPIAQPKRSSYRQFSVLTLLGVAALLALTVGVSRADGTETHGTGRNAPATLIVISANAPAP